MRNSQVYCISDELLNTPAPTLVAGLRALAGAIHPATVWPANGTSCDYASTAAEITAARLNLRQLGLGLVSWLTLKVSQGRRSTPGSGSLE